MVMAGWNRLLVYARRISFEKIPAIPAHLRRFRACAYTYTALRPRPPHLTPDWPDFFESRSTGSEMRRADHLAPRPSTWLRAGRPRARCSPA